MLIRPLPTNLLQIFCIIILNFKSIIKSIISPDDTSYKVLKHEWVKRHFYDWFAWGRDRSLWSVCVDNPYHNRAAKTCRQRNKSRPVVLGGIYDTVTSVTITNILCHRFLQLVAFDACLSHHSRLSYRFLPSTHSCSYDNHWQAQLLLLPYKVNVHVYDFPKIGR